MRERRALEELGGFKEDGGMVDGGWIRLRIRRKTDKGKSSNG